ncbi:Peptidase_C39 like family protein [Ruminococcus sp. YE71]|uniref:C39 family peptidase n=1 Tax=unclassified Ruminococcus TaxID=2608920 RepID=UPI0008831D67|nr:MULTISPECIES: C39 family peptidase [unclassified Ruminococcus]SDA14264.1 Peptidase_C39 like family protein [Ruminococcus sp. YE78]SFW20782.1 Peptidase_C39 like family protein [Ruminococcus sp. YE71]
MKKSKLTVTVLGIFIGCTAVLIIMMIAYGVTAAVKKSGGKAAELKPEAVTTTTAKQAETAPADTVSDETQPVEAEVPDKTPADGNSSMVFKVGGSAQGANAQNGVYTGLYQLDQKTPIYVQPDDAEAPVTEYPDLYSKGYYTGRPFSEDGNYIEIDYRDGKALVPAENVMSDTSAIIMPVGMVCQITSGYVGYSGSAPACLHMMERYTGIKPVIPELSDYSQLLAYAQDHGYSDQGSLYLYGGGMSADAVMNFAKDIYGYQLVNAYDANRKPSEVVKEILESGRQAMVLVKFDNGDMVQESGLEHYMLFTGYTEKNGTPEFIYANSYREDKVDLGYPLRSCDADLLDKSAGAKFTNENAILCIS